MMAVGRVLGSLFVAHGTGRDLAFVWFKGCKITCREGRCLFTRYRYIGWLREDERWGHRIKKNIVYDMNIVVF